MSKKLTPAMRAPYEGHKNALYKNPIIKEHLINNADLDRVGKYSISTPERYIKEITLDEDIALGKFFEKIITLGSSQGFVAFMMLYQYMYDKNLLGKEIDCLTGQEIIDHIYQENSYKLKPRNKQRFLCSIVQLSGLQFYLEDHEETQNIRKVPGKEGNFYFKSFTLLKVKGFETLPDKETIVSLNGVSIMKDFINIWYKKMSRLFIPLEDILKIPHDFHKDHRRGFNLSLALRHAELASQKDYVEWTLEQCLNVGQWQAQARRKSEAWKQIIESLDAGKSRELIDYYFIYKANKPAHSRYIERVIIKRLWQPGSENLKLHFSPEELTPKKRGKKIVF
ncbi:hypothetical protein H0X48_03700 [Candidatus Dependentiae bacterium]|nr:hypothetical protein [Candidatus Dependentiae bacterium]